MVVMRAWATVGVVRVARKVVLLLGTVERVHHARDHMGKAKPSDERLERFVLIL